MAHQQHIGLLGGSFDPVHRAHIALAERALTELNLDSLQLIAAANPWQRAPLAATPEQRLHMLELACVHNPKLHINRSEIDRGGATYTIDTLRALPKGPVYYWILGADQLQNFCSWNHWQEILEHVELAVAKRPGSSYNTPAALAAELQKQHKTLHQLNFSPIDISASHIRHILALQQDPSHFLDPAVAHYIQAEGLYRQAANSTDTDL